MAQKKITDLELRTDFDATCNVPVDDATQTWRTTGAQVRDFIIGDVVDDSTLQFAGGDLKVKDAGVTRAKLAQGAVARLKRQAKTANYTILDTDDLVYGNPNGGTFTLTLPGASTYGEGRILKIVNSNSSATDFTALTLARAGSDTIVEGATTALTSTKLVTAGESLELESDGSSAWTVVSRKWPTEDVSYTATATNFTVTSQSTTFSRIARDKLLVKTVMVINTVAAAEARFSLPGSLTAVVPASASGCGVGVGPMFTNSGGGIQSVIAENGVAYLTFGSGSSLISKNLANSAFGSGGYYTFHAVVPITGW